MSPFGPTYGSRGRPPHWTVHCFASTLMASVRGGVTTSETRGGVVACCASASDGASKRAAKKRMGTPGFGGQYRVRYTGVERWELVGTAFTAANGQRRLRRPELEQKCARGTSGGS